MSAPPDHTVTEILASLPGLTPDGGASYNPTLVLAQQQARAAEVDTASMLVPRGVVEPPQPRPGPGAEESSGSPLAEYIARIPVNERFELDKPLAKGGIGEVWNARQKALQRVLAVKRLRLDKFPKDEMPQGLSHPIEVAFYQEALLTANLEHPNIVPVYDLGIDEEGRLLLAMKLIRGHGWNELIRKDFGTMPIGKFLRKHLQVLMGVCEAVRFAHSRGIVHRDLKPAQVVVGDYGEVQLMDWGLAIVYDTAAARNTIPHVMELNAVPTTRDGPNPAGTPAFMAPEQLDKTTQRICPATDVFLLGGILYQLLTGAGPYSGMDSKTAMARAAVCDMRPIQERAGERFVPQELAALANWALSRSIADRPQTVRVFMDHLADFLENAERRWESLELTARVDEALRAPGVDIRALGLLQSQVDNAAGLWPRNPEIDPLRSRIVAAHTNLLVNEDYQTHRAITMANSLSDKRLRNYLIAHIERGWGRQKRRKSLVTQLIILGVVLLGILAAAALYQLVPHGGGAAEADAAEQSG